MERDESKWDRRGFLRGAALAGLGTVAFGALTGCSPKATGDGDSTNGTTSEAGGGIPADRWQSQAAADWRTPPSVVDESLIQDGGTFDIVVAGGGQSGTWAARAATRDGASVAVIEILTPEEFLYIGSEIGTVNCQWAIDHGGERIDTVKFLNEAYRRNAGRSNQSIIRRYAENSGRLLDWAINDLEDSEWMEVNAHVHGRDRLESMVMDPGGFYYFIGTINFRSPDIVEAPSAVGVWGEKMMAHHREKAIADGALWEWGCEALYLEKNDSGRVVALVAKKLGDETYVRYKAIKAIILALGDFSDNEDMLRDLNDEYRHIAESYGDINLAVSGSFMGVRKGSGVKLGIWAGGHVEVGPRAGMVTNLTGPSPLWGPGFPMLNQYGKRFCDECAGGAEGPGYLAPRQPRGAIVSLADANWKEVTSKMPPCHNSVDYTYGLPYKLTIGAIEETMAAISPSGEANEQDIYCADTIDELLSAMGIYSDDEKAQALAEIERYNAMAKAHYDTDFGADARIIKPLDTPPFYGAWARSDALWQGLCQAIGLDTSEKNEVLDFDLRPIPGLYAVGNDSGNRFIVQYSTPTPGMSLGFVLTEGLSVGEMLAAQ